MGFCFVFVLHFIAENKTARAQLFGSEDVGTKPKPMTPEEIRAKYRKSAVNVSAAAAQAKTMLEERKEKLEQINQHSEELEVRSQDYASMAKELAKKMDKKKWWQL
ncbi:hypothetical protein LINPERPRIM_LOCUS25919 [Linum perenne]